MLQFLIQFLTILIFIALPALAYLFFNRKMLIIVLKPSNKTTFLTLYKKITYPIFIIGGVLTFIPCFYIIGQYWMWGVMPALNIIFCYIVIASLIQGILFIIIAPKHIHRPIKSVLLSMIMANVISIIVILVLMPVLLYGMATGLLLMQK